LTFSVFRLSAQTVFGISNNNLIRFDAATPSVILSSTTITGIAAGMEISGLDCRPATGQLYALGYEASSGMARLYVLNTTTAEATAIGNASVQLEANMGKVSMDFNPTVDRIRVVGSNNSNFRMHPVTGAVVATDGDLAFATADPNAAQNPSIGAITYTNSYIGASSTTLINFDDSLNVFCTQIPPNNGTLNTIGSIGVSVDLSEPQSDFDIFFDSATNANMGLFSTNLSAASSTSVLLSVNLTTGLATSIGTIGLTGQLVSDIAVAISAPSSGAVTGQLAYALNGANSLISFDTDSPGNVRTQVGISGLTMGQTLVGLDFRPKTGQLVALGYNATNSECQLYTVNPATGVATAISPTPFTLSLGNGTTVGFDFNPTVDRIRVVASNNANVRLNPITGELAATDLSLAFAVGDANATANAAIGAAAYTNSFNGATSTTLYVYDDSLNVLCTQVPPNNGTLNTLGSSSLVQNLTDPTSDMDIYYDFGTASNLAFATANPTGGIADFLYQINLSTGQFSLIGKVGLGIAVRDLAILIDSIIPTVSAFAPTKMDHSLLLSPNPTNGEVMMQLDLQQQGMVECYLTDMMGRTTMLLAPTQAPAGRFETRFNLSEKPAGLYMVQLYLDGQLRGRSKVIRQAY
jgi:trimeric autotransporter adhesin